MKLQQLNDIQAFVVVARERSFTRAAAKLGLSQSTLSHTVRNLEERIGVRLLTRTTRSVSPTEAGDQLLQSVAPRLEEIASDIEAVREYRDKPVGTIRITAIEKAIDEEIWPKLAPLLHQNPDLKIEISADYRLVDIVAERFDIGVRMGDQVAKDMIAVRIAPDQRTAIAASPEYLKARGEPQTVEDLIRHNCITLRLSSGALYAWELIKDGKDVTVKLDGQVTCNGVTQMLNAAIDGCGLVFMPEGTLRPHVDAGRLRWVMPHCWPTWPGLHAYYPSRRASSRALKLVIDALRMSK
jgi:DNA-binding transcriptional LysR family regulator